jgi:hypothetical protein
MYRRDNQETVAVREAQIWLHFGWSFPRDDCRNTLKRTVLALGHFLALTPLFPSPSQPLSFSGRMPLGMEIR